MLNKISITDNDYTANIEENDKFNCFFFFFCEIILYLNN